MGDQPKQAAYRTRSTRRRARPCGEEPPVDVRRECASLDTSRRERETRRRRHSQPLRGSARSSVLVSAKTFFYQTDSGRPEENQMALTHGQDPRRTRGTLADAGSEQPEDRDESARRRAEGYLPGDFSAAFPVVSERLAALAAKLKTRDGVVEIMSRRERARRRKADGGAFERKVSRVFARPIRERVRMLAIRPVPHDQWLVELVLNEDGDVVGEWGRSHTCDRLFASCRRTGRSGRLISDAVFRRSGGASRRS